MYSCYSYVFRSVQNWRSISDSNKITFKIKSALGMVDGSIGVLKGTVSFDPNDLLHGNLDVTLDLATITTGNGKRDKNIKEETIWFDIAKYPKIAFKSAAVSKTSTGYSVDGTLTIKGTAKKVQIPFTFADAAGGGTFTGTLKLKVVLKIGRNSGRDSSILSYLFFKMKNFRNEVCEDAITLRLTASY